MCGRITNGKVAISFCSLSPRVTLSVKLLNGVFLVPFEKTVDERVFTSPLLGEDLSC